MMTVLPVYQLGSLKRPDLFSVKPVITARQRIRCLVSMVFYFALVNGVNAGTESSSFTTTRISNAEKCYRQAVNSEFDQRHDLQALFHCNKALRFDTLTLENKARTYINRGVLLKNMAMLERAGGDFRRANLLLRRSADIQVNLGNLAYLRGDFDLALQQYDRALEWNISEPYKAYLNRGLALERLGDMDAARNSYQQALIDNPQLDIAREQLRYIGSVKPVAMTPSGRTPGVYLSGT